MGSIRFAEPEERIARIEGGPGEQCGFVDIEVAVMRRMQRLRLPGVSGSQIGVGARYMQERFL